MVINAMAMGMTMSLVPTIVSAFARRDYKDVESKINKSLSMIIFISLPMSIGLSILARPVWTMFYGASDIGSTILKLTAFSALFGNLYMIVSAICQSLNKYKAVYMVSGIGFLLNAALDVPIMLLYNWIGIPTYLGSITASIIGYSTSTIIGLILLRQDGKYSYKQAVINGFKTLVPAISMLVVLLVMNHFITLNESIRPTALIKIVIDTVVGGIIYVTVAFKTGLIEEVLGRQMLARLLKKFTFGLVKLKEVE
jgi:PST family polysaccharide transporter